MRGTRAVIVVAAMALGACTSGNQPPAPQAQGPIAQVQVETLTPGDISEQLEVYGTVEYPPRAQSTISATSVSVVEQILVANGQGVRRGQPLIRIRPSATALQELSSATNDAAAARVELARVQRMFAQHLATNADLTLARQAFANTQAALASANSRIGGSNARVLHADRDTTVIDIAVARGDIVAADAPLLRLASTGEVMVRLGVEPADVAVLRIGLPVDISPVYDPRLILQGTISQVMEQVDAQTRLLQATVALPRADGLLPGSTVRGAIQLRQRRGVLTVARAAVLFDGDKPFAFVVDQGKARRTALKTGIDNGQRIEVLKGMRAGEQVVVSGNYELEDGMPVTIAAAGQAPAP